MQGGGSTGGAGLVCKGCRGLNITGSSFTSMKSILGGGIHIQEADSNKKSGDKYGKYLI